MNKIEKPNPQGKYISVKRTGELIFTAGITPRKNGKIILEGPIKINDNIEKWKESAELVAKNLIACTEGILNNNEKIGEILSMTVFINTENGYREHSKIADFISEYFYQVLKNSGIASRTAVGVCSLPGNAPLEVQLIARIENKKL